MLNSALILVFLGLLAPSSAARLHNSFQHFLPGFGPEISDIVKTKCFGQFQAYRNESIQVYGIQCVKTYSCIMEEVSEYTKANMQASAVLLGLTPWILSVIGSTSSEIALFSARRPLIAFWLVVGSPAVIPSNVFRNPFEEYLKLGPGHKILPKLSPSQHKLCLTMEIFFTMANVANIATLSWQLALTTIPVMSCDSDQIAGMWVALVAVTHILGLTTFFIRARFPQTRPPNKSRWQSFKHWFRVRWGLVTEFKHGTNQPPLDLIWGEESWAFLAVSWLTTTYTIIHMAFGTLVLSSLSFVGIEDATKIAARFVVSAIISRVIVTYEVYGMRSTQMRANTRARDDLEMQNVAAVTEVAPGPTTEDSKSRIKVLEEVVVPENRPARQGNSREN